MKCIWNNDNVKEQNKKKESYYIMSTHRFYYPFLLYIYYTHLICFGNLANDI